MHGTMTTFPYYVEIFSRHIALGVHRFNPFAVGPPVLRAVLARNIVAEAGPAGDGDLSTVALAEIAVEGLHHNRRE